MVLLTPGGSTGGAVCSRMQVNAPSMVGLLRARMRLIDAALAGDDALATALGNAVVAGWATSTGALQTGRDALAAARTRRGGARFFVAGDPPELVG